MKLIKIKEDHYVVVDDSEIQEGDYWINDHSNSYYIDIKAPVSSSRFAVNSNAVFSNPKKITHSTQPLEPVVVDISPVGTPIIDYEYDKVKQLSLQEVKELIGEVDVMTKAVRDVEGTSWDEDAKPSFLSGYLRGYRQTLEDNKEKKYTEEDLLKFTEWVETSQEASDYDKKNRMRFAPKMEGNSEVKKRLPELYSLYTQSLQPKTEWEVEIVDGKLKLK